MGPWRREAELVVIEVADLRPEEGTEREDDAGMEPWLAKEERERTTLETVREVEEAIAISLFLSLLVYYSVCVC